MNYQELLNEIKNPEKEVIELKNSFSQLEDIGRTIAAFSTKKGGKIFVGVDRKGCPCGTLCNNEIKGKLQGIANNEIKPSANISTELVTHDAQKSLIIACIHISKGNGVYSYKGVHYERRGDTNHPLTADEIFELQKNIKKLYFDEMPSLCEERPALVSDVDELKILSYLSLIKNIKEQLDMRRFLSNHSFLVNGEQQVKNAAIMIFGKEPQKFIPQLKISISFFSGKNITDSFIKKEVTGDIYEIFQKTFIELQRNITTYSFVEGKQRLDVLEYPLEVIRECLINSIVHRDYFDKGTETFIKMFSDRIEIVNPACFPFENYTFDEIRKTKISKRRNPLVANFLESVGLMEKEGRGITKIEEGMKEHGLPPPYFEAGQKTLMVVLKNSENKTVLKNSPYKKIIDFGLLNERQILLIEHLRKSNIKYISRAEYISLITLKGIPLTDLTASRDLHELTGKNILTKFGDKRGTRYLLTW